MPKYFFHIHDGLSFPDEEGTDLTDLAAARLEAAQLAGQMMKDDSQAFWNGEDWSVQVTDEASMTLFTLHFMSVQAAATRSAKPLVAVPPTPSHWA